MQIIIAGATGYIGTSVLQHALSHPSITSVLILSRRDPGAIASHAKATTILLSDFTSYPPSVISQLRSASAAIWCIGSFDGNQAVDITYPLAFIDAVKSSGAKPFRYIHLGGGFTEPPPQEGEVERNLWFYVNGRRVRGEAEARVAKTEGEGFEVCVVKPGAVLPWGAGVLRYVLGEALHVGIDEAGKVMVDLAVQGSEKRVWLNRDVVRRARELGEERK